MKASGGVAEWLAGKSEAELIGIEFGTKRFYPDTVKKRVGDKLVEEPILLHVPSPLDGARARVDSIEFIRKLSDDKTIRTVAEAKAKIGEELFSEIDAYFYMSIAIYRRPSTGEQPSQWMLPELMLDTVPRGAIYDLLARSLFYAGREDPRNVEVDKATFVEAVKAIAREKNLSPLAAIDGAARDSFVLSMALHLSTSPTFSA